ncbi:sugar ABC transporter ATP-binding protein [bacterium]|nr:sugar ABC transporter ATP-binding protein [bacterium]
MATAAVRLEVRQVTKRFGGVVALSNVSLEARSGEVHAICGENGAGKSTLMKILSGALTADEGEVLLNGKSARFSGPRDAEKAGISIIYQELNLVPDLSAAANIFLGRELVRGGIFLDDRSMERQADILFQQLGAPFSSRTKVRDLRIGDQQMVEIAKALSLDADVLIMDEPTSALAEGEVQRLYRVVDSLKAQGVTVLYISHKMDEIFRLADRITVFRDGKNVATRIKSETSPSEIIPLMVGRDLIPSDRSKRPPSGKIKLRVENLSLPHATQAGRMQLDGVTFELRAGEILGIAGLLGAGRTELLESLFGATSRHATGQILIDGQSARSSSPAQAMQLGLAMVTEDRKGLGLFDQMTVKDNISMCSLQSVARGPWISSARENSTCQQQVQRWGVKTSSIHAPILSLSGGNQQKCILARWLLTCPSILLLDEPTRGIDVGAKAEIYRILEELRAQGMAMVMTSSELPELLSVSDRILVLCEGRLTGEFSHAEATEEKIMHAATAFLSTNN